MAIVCLILSALPAGMFFWNVFLFRRLPEAGENVSVISVLIPARNEEAGIADCLQSVLACAWSGLEVIVLDDGSTDRTSEMVAAISAQDSRVKLRPAPPLPPGWCGKQHACYQLSLLASHDLLMWIDADVRLSADAIPRLVNQMNLQPEVGLLSGFPKQETGTFNERLLIPLIHFVLLGFLPITRMRTDQSPSLGAGCGQLFVARRVAYEEAGGHAAIRTSLHDGIKLPRAFRSSGQMTDVFDATDIARCRMYHSGGETFAGLGKNATEGMASVAAIGPWTILLLGGQVLPAILIFVAVFTHDFKTIVISLIALVIAWTVRLAAAVRFGQSKLSAILHPLGIAMLIAIQWIALLRKLRKRPAVWRGRAYGGVEAKSAQSSHD